MNEAAEAEASPAASPPPAVVAIWDLPVRIVHWSFALLLPALWATWQFGQMPLHRMLGYGTLGLLLFRFYWGFAGSSTARFAAFVKGPRAVLGYARGLFGAPGAPLVGHNPLGGLSVVALLGLLALQLALGLFSQDVDGVEAGPLSGWVSWELSDLAREWHGQIFYVLLGFVVLHLCAIAFHVFVKRDNLVSPMVTGRKRIDALVEEPRFAPLSRLVIGVLLSAGLSWWIASGCPLPG